MTHTLKELRRTKAELYAQEEILTSMPDMNRDTSFKLEDVRDAIDGINEEISDALLEIH
jgi:hypothetical protein